MLLVRVSQQITHFLLQRTHTAISRDIRESMLLQGIFRIWKKDRRVGQMCACNWGCRTHYIVFWKWPIELHTFKLLNRVTILHFFLHDYHTEIRKLEAVFNGAVFEEIPTMWSNLTNKKTTPKSEFLPYTHDFSLPLHLLPIIYVINSHQSSTLAQIGFSAAAQRDADHLG